MRNWACAHRSISVFLLLFLGAFFLSTCAQIDYVPPHPMALSPPRSEFIDERTAAYKDQSVSAPQSKPISEYSEFALAPRIDITDERTTAYIDQSVSAQQPKSIDECSEVALAPRPKPIGAWSVFALVAPQPEFTDERKPEAKPQSAPAPESSEPVHKIAISKSIKAKKYYMAEKYNEYKVVLGADPVIKIPGPPGKLRVWIGMHDYKPNFSEDIKQATDTLPAIGTIAKITPFAPAFRVDPKESVCIRIHPTGSEVGFTLTPIEEGIFYVGADVNLYNSDNCSGPPVPKGTTTLQVQVVVDHVKERKEHAKKFREVFWEKLLKFWGELLVLCSAVILFLIRKRLKKWIGFGKDN